MTPRGDTGAKISLTPGSVMRPPAPLQTKQAKHPKQIPLGRPQVFWMFWMFWMFGEGTQRTVRTPTTTPITLMMKEKSHERQGRNWQPESRRTQNRKTSRLQGLAHYRRQE